MKDVATLSWDARISARQAVFNCIERINAFDRAGPKLNSILEMNPDAMDIADGLDRERAEKGPRGLLHGVPVILKDSFATADKMQTTAGSLALEGLYAPKDAFVVRRLREAGAVILAKANCHELSFGMATVSSRGGQTLNPYALDRQPGGSSGGTAVAITCGFGTVGIGEDTAGSIRSPVGFNSLVGIRPTLGLVSRSGIVPLAPTRDTAGPMTRTVADAAALLDVIAGYDPDDPATACCLHRFPGSYMAFLDRDGLRGARIGVVRDLFGKETAEDLAVNAVVNAALREMATLGATIVDPVNVPQLSEVLDREKYPFEPFFEWKFALKSFLAQMGPSCPVHSLEEVLASGKTHPSIQPMLMTSVQVESLDDPRYLRTIGVCHRLAKQCVYQALADQNLDALAYPPIQRPPAKLGVQQQGTLPTGIAARSGFPSIIVPAGLTEEGLPVGIELLGWDFDEPTLIRLAYSFEQGTGHRQPPPVA